MTREEAAKMIKDDIRLHHDYLSGKYRHALNMAIETLQQPEIIHCHDCKHWQSEEYIGNNNVYTLNIASLPCKNWLTAGEWHCGSAERREDDCI